MIINKTLYTIPSVEDRNMKTINLRINTEAYKRLHLTCASISIT